MLKEEGSDKLVVLFFIILLLIPLVDAANIFEAFKEGLNPQKGLQSITGRDAVTVSITIGNNAPNISFVSLDAQTFSPSNGGIRQIEVSFLADDPEGSSNLDNSSALVNVSYQSSTGSGFLSSSSSSCSGSYIPTGDIINYSCTVQMQYYYDHSTEWQVDAEIQDNNNNYFLNASAINGGNWTFQELVAFNLTTSSLSWGAVVPADTNQTDTSSEATENTGNSLSLNIRNTLIDLGGVSNQATNIPAGNFTVGNITSGAKVECNFANQTATVTPGVLPLVGINNTQIFPLTNAIRRGQGSSNNLYYCLFDVPADLTSQTYDTTAGGSWDITAVDSGE